MVVLKALALLSCAGLVSWFAQTPDDPYPEKSEYAEHPVKNQLDRSALTKGLWKGEGQKIDQRMEQDGQE